ncbi:MAG: DUF1330 domain-containing protein [Pseudomonadota bacterium]
MRAVIIGTAVLFACLASASSGEPLVPKGYAVAEILVTNPVAYKDYVAAVTPLVAKYGGAYIVRAGETVPKEGDAPAGRIVILEFGSLAAARAFYESAEYQAILPLRQKNATSRVYLVEGFLPQ